MSRSSSVVLYGMRWESDGSGMSAAIRRSRRGRSSSFSLSGRARAVADRDERQPGAGMAGDHAGEQRQVVLDDGGRDRCRCDVDHAQSGLAEQQEQEEEPLLVCLRHAPAACAETIERHRGDDHDRLVVEVQAHRIPHRRQVALEAIEDLVPLLVVEVGQGDRVGRECSRRRLCS